MRFAVVGLGLLSLSAPASAAQYIDVLNGLNGRERVITTTCSAMMSYGMTFKDAGTTTYANMEVPTDKALLDQLTDSCASGAPVIAKVRVEQTGNGDLAFNVVEVLRSTPTDALTLPEFRSEIDTELAKIDQITAHILTGEDDLMIVNFTNDGFGLVEHLWLNSIAPKRALEYLNTCYMKCTDIVFKFEKPVATGDFGMGIDPLYPDDWAMPEDVAAAAPAPSGKNK